MAAETFDLGLRIVGDSKEAVKAIDDLDKEMSGLKVVTKETESSLSDLETKTKSVAKTADDASTSTNTLSKSMKDLGKSLSGIGRSLTVVTAPLTILAGLSLKNVFALGELEGADKNFKDFAVSVNILIDNFKSLTVEIGTKLIPVVQPLINVFTNIISYFRRLDDETKELVGTIALIAGVLGPALIAFGTLSTLVGSLIPVFIAVKTALTAVAAAISPVGIIIGSLIATVVGLTGVFMKLKEAGMSTADALYQSFNLFVTGFNKYIVGSLAKGLTAILSMLADFTGIFSSEIEASVNKAVLSVAGFADGLDAQFEAQKSHVDSVLATIGSSAGDAFTLGLGSKLSGISDKIKSMFESQDTAGLDLGLAKALDKEVKESEKPLTEIQKKAQQIQDTITNTMTDAFMSISDGTKSAEQAFKDMAMSIIRDLKRMAIQAAITKALFPGGGLSGAVAGFASGGYVRGPGTSTSDSIPARLSDGEFVVRASAVKSVGVGFLSAINSLGSRSLKRKQAGGFADGGMVTAPASSGVSVNVTNNGAQKDVTEASYDPETMVVSVVLDDLNKNGSISRAIGGTFGVSRGNFR